MSKFITVTGGKGGVGKTSISLNLALCLSKLGSKVCLFDADLGMANVNILLGLYPEYYLEDVMSGKKSIQDIILLTGLGIDVIPGSSGVQKLANLNSDEIARMISAFSGLEKYDYFMFDTSAGITDSVISFCRCSSEVIVVITPEPTSLTDAYALVKVLTLNGFSGKFRVVVNQCKNTKAAKQTFNLFRDVAEKYLDVYLKPLGVVPQDARVSEAVQKQQPLVKLFPESNTAKSIQNMAYRLASNQSEQFEQMKISDFFSKFLEFTRNSVCLSNP